MAVRNDQPATETHSPPRGTGITEPERTRYWTLRHWEEIVENLPVPGDRWRWTEVDLPHRLKYILKECNHIRPARTVDGYWRTTRQYYRYVEQTAHEDEKPVGTRIRGHSRDRSDREAVRGATGPTEQATLFGDSTVAGEDAGREDRRAGRDEPENDEPDRDRARNVVPGQTTIDGAEFINAGDASGRWVMRAGPSTGRLARAKGDAYPVETPTPEVDVFS